MADSKILIVDDVNSNLFLLKLLLGKKVDADIFEAESGSLALEHFKEHSFKLAILDLYMPRMNGYDLACEIRAIEGQESMPIFFLTADVQTSELVALCKKFEHSEIIIKPVVKEDLYQLILKHTDIELMQA